LGFGIHEFRSSLPPSDVAPTVTPAEHWEGGASATHDWGTVSMPTGLIRQFWRAMTPRGRFRYRGRTSSQETLILVFNSMWDQPVGEEPAVLGAGCRITSDVTTFGDAAAVVFHIPSLRKLPTLKPRGQLWVAWSMESEVNYPRLRDPSFMRQFDLTMTYRLDADVAVAYTSYYGDVANLARALRIPPRPKSGDKLASLFISSGINRSGRIEYATELMRYLEIHSYGRVLMNREVPLPDRGRPSKLDTLAHYKFDLSFENSCAEDYVTEKFFDPLVAGTVPVYLGAPNVDRFAPGDRCFINTGDFQNPKDLADYLLYLARDESAYAAYHSWKQHPFRPSFHELLEGQEAPPFGRLCREITTRQRGKR
jgi:hypothetical protein